MKDNNAPKSKTKWNKSVLNILYQTTFSLAFLAPTDEEKFKIVVLFDFYKTLKKYDGYSRASQFVMESIERVFKHDIFDVLELHIQRSKNRKACGKFEARLKSVLLISATGIWLNYKIILSFMDQISLTESDDVWCNITDYILRDVSLYGCYICFVILSLCMKILNIEKRTVSRISVKAAKNANGCRRTITQRLYSNLELC